MALSYNNFLSQHSNSSSLERHVFILENLLRRAEHIDSIRAIGIGGSFARGNSDGFSDIDLCPFMRGGGV